MLNAQSRKKEGPLLALAHTPHSLINKKFLHPQGPIVLRWHPSEKCTLEHLADLCHVSVVVLYLCPVYPNHNQRVARPCAASASVPCFTHNASWWSSPQGCHLPRVCWLGRERGRGVGGGLVTSVNSSTFWIVQALFQKPKHKEQQTDSPRILKHLKKAKQAH